MKTRAGTHLQELRLKSRRVSRPWRVDSRGARSAIHLRCLKKKLIAEFSQTILFFSNIVPPQSHAPENSKHFGAN